jgi:hypothetical protein
VEWKVAWLAMGLTASAKSSGQAQHPNPEQRWLQSSVFVGTEWQVPWIPQISRYSGSMLRGQGRSQRSGPQPSSDQDSAGLPGRGRQVSREWGRLGMAGLSMAAQQVDQTKQVPPLRLLSRPDRAFQEQPEMGLLGP